MTVQPEKPISAARMARTMLGRSPGWLREHRGQLEAAGFPKPLPVLGTYLPSQVRLWLDRPAAPAPKSAFDDGLQRLLNGKRRGKAA